MTNTLPIFNCEIGCYKLVSADSKLCAMFLREFPVSCDVLMLYNGLQQWLPCFNQLYCCCHRRRNKKKKKKQEQEEDKEEVQEGLQVEEEERDEDENTEERRKKKIRRRSEEKTEAEGERNTGSIKWYSRPIRTCSIGWVDGWVCGVCVVWLWLCVWL